MNYRHIYMLIIERAKSEEKLGLRKKGNGEYYEKHHILPKSLFPLWRKRKSNLVLLTAREHFFCHQLLTKIYPSYATSCALFYMCNGNKHQRSVCSTRDYERARIEFSKWNSFMRKGKEPWNKCKKCPQLKSPVWMHTEECRTKMKETLKARYAQDLIVWNKGVSFMETLTEDERKKRFGKCKGKKRSPEAVEKTAKKLRGQKRTEEQLKHYKEASLKRAKMLKSNGTSKRVGEINRIKRSKPIFCPELNTIFSSRKEAAEYFQTVPGRITAQIERTKNGKLYRGKYHIFEVSKESNTIVINHNMAAMYASRMEGINTANVLKTSKELSSGMRINSAADDASGLAVSEKMRSQIRGLNQASRNVMNGVSMLQTAEGYMQSTTDILQRIRELAVQSANGIYSDEDRAMLQTEVEQLVSEVDRISQTAEFNGMTLLSGRFAEDGIKLQVGANTDQNFTVKLGNMSATALGLKVAGQDGTEQSISLSDPESANMALATVDEALKVVNKNRADVGASMNRMEMAQKGINIASENIAASESRIRDADYAETAVNFARDQVLQQTASAMLAQSLNIGRDSVLRLLS